MEPPAAEVALAGAGIVAASWMDALFVHPHLVLGSLRSWKSGEKRWDSVFVARTAAAESNGAEKRAIAGRAADRRDGPWTWMHLRTMIPDESDLGSDERRVRPWQGEYN